MSAPPIARVAAAKAILEVTAPKDDAEKARQAANDGEPPPWLRPVPGGAQ